jgi:hypothetical protein
MAISRSVLWMRNISYKSSRENQNTHFIFSIFLFRKFCLLWDNVEKYRRPRQATDDNIIRHMRIACWITKPKDTHWEYVIIITFHCIMVTRTRLHVTFKLTLPVAFFHYYRSGLFCSFYITVCACIFEYPPRWPRGVLRNHAYDFLMYPTSSLWSGESHVICLQPRLVVICIHHRS